MVNNNKKEDIFKSSKLVVAEALKTIRDYQQHIILPAKTGYDYMDKALMGGLRPQCCIAIGGRTGTGKSYIAQKVLESLMNVNLNPQANEYILLRCEFEMNPRDLLLRRISRESRRSIEDIINYIPTAEDNEIIEHIAKEEANDRIIYIDKPCTADEFCDNMNTRFLPHYADKKLIIVSIDHIALVKRSGGDPKRTIDTLLAGINDMKLKYKNVVFIIITQFNRDIENRTEPKDMSPRLSDVYQSDELAQLCEMVIGLNNPFSMGIDKYMLFNPLRYEQFDRFKTEKKNQFLTDGLMFHHILKLRMKNMRDRNYPLDDIYVEAKTGYMERYGLSEEHRQDSRGGYESINFGDGGDPLSASNPMVGENPFG